MSISDLVAGGRPYAQMPWNVQMSILLFLYASGMNGLLVGNGNPEGVVTGVVGQHYWDQTGHVDYVKETGTGNTGWTVFLGI